MKTRTTLQRAALLTAALALGACASIQPQTTEEQVMARAQARWDALVARDFDKAYDLVVPSFRALVQKQQYKERFGSRGRWTDAAVHSAKCEAERCTVTVRIAANVPVHLPGMGAGHQHHVASYNDEVWVREEGHWWFYQTP